MNTALLRFSAALALLLAVESAPAQQDEQRRRAIELNNRAVALLEKKAFDEAIDLLEKAHRADPSGSGIRTNLAAAYGRRADRRLEEKKYHFARADFLHAAELCPELGRYRLSAALVLFRQEKYAAALEDLQRLVKRFPTLVDAWYLLGECQLRRHDVVAAVASWRKGAAIDPEHAGIQAALRRHGPDAELEKELYTDLTPNFAYHYHLYRGAVAKSAPTLSADLERAFLFCQNFFLGYLPRERIHVLLYGREEFRAITHTAGWVGGLFDGRVRLPVDNYEKERRHLLGTIRHELTHAFAHDLSSRVPIWLDEGLAQIAGGKRPAVAAAYLRRAGTLSESKLWKSFTSLESEGEVHRAYATSLLLCSHIDKLYGRAALLGYLRQLDREPKKSAALVFDEYFRTNLGSVLDEVRRRNEIRKR